MVLVEADKLAVMGCLPGRIQAQRYRELSYEIHTMHVHNPNAIVYLDAGASDWVPWPHMTRELRRADITEAQGFALGASHFDWTSNEVSYGMKISHALGGKHFVINTNSNAHGPKPRYYSPYYHGGLHPARRGDRAAAHGATPDPHIDAFLWLGTPGFEAGVCLGQRQRLRFNLTEALSLVKNALPGLCRPAAHRPRALRQRRDLPGRRVHALHDAEGGLEHPGEVDQALAEVRGVGQGIPARPARARARSPAAPSRWRPRARASGRTRRGGRRPCWPGRHRSPAPPPGRCGWPRSRTRETNSALAG